MNLATPTPNSYDSSPVLMVNLITNHNSHRHTGTPTHQVEYYTLNFVKINDIIY